MGQPSASSRAELVAQLRSQGIRDERVLAAMAKVRREAFVRPDLRHAAYADGPLPIAEGQTISQPYIVALMTEALALRQDDRVLEIGTGSGYQTAVLSELGARVVSIERYDSLAQRAALRLHALGYRQVSIHTVDGSIGWPDSAPYEGIIVTAGSPGVPKQLLAQLALGGRLVIPVGGMDRQTLKLIVKQRECQPTAASQPASRSDGDREGIAMLDLGPCRFVPLLGQGGWKAPQ